ncbi:MAG: energy transducer TonB, partial [Chitinophagaceae bacterium]
MEANKILNADLLDLVFEGRNKAYGAYDLRKSYNKRIRTALLVTASIFLLALLFSFLSDKLTPTENEIVVEEVELAKVAEPEPPKAE